MKPLFHFLFRVLVLPLFGLSMASCRGQEDENFGWCRLSCSSTTLAGSDFVLGAHKEPAGYQCRSASGPAGFMSAAWKISASDDVPRSAIAFNAELGGVVPYTEGDPAENSSAWHQGIKTPQSEWCSDSCGIARVLFRAECIDETQTGTIFIESGSVSSSFSISITAPEE